MTFGNTVKILKLTSMAIILYQGLFASTPILHYLANLSQKGLAFLLWANLEANLFHIN